MCHAPARRARRPPGPRGGRVGGRRGGHRHRYRSARLPADGGEDGAGWAVRGTDGGVGRPGAAGREDVRDDTVPDSGQRGRRGRHGAAGAGRHARARRAGARGPRPVEPAPRCRRPYRRRARRRVRPGRRRRRPGRGRRARPARRWAGRLPAGPRAVKKIFAVTLGILTAIGGFIDVGDFVASSQAGARFGMSLAWVLVLGVVGICVYSEMAGRVTAISHLAVFDLIRERLGPRVALINLVAASLVTLITLGAELGGVALALELATSINYLLWVPVAGFVL